MPRNLLSPRYQLLRELIKVERKRKGMSQAEVAQKLGRPQSYVADFERRERRIDVIEFLALAEAIGFDAVELIKGVLLAKKN